MIYLLDTNACIALINGRPVMVRQRFQQALGAGATMAVSSIVLFELRYGVAKSAHPDADTKQMEVFLSGPVELLPFDKADASEAGLIRAALEAAGTRFGAYDLLIAGQARRRGLTLVTADVPELARVAGLSWENWADTTAGT